MDKEAAQSIVQSVPHWHHRYEISPGVVTPGSYDPTALFASLRLPPDLTGQRALDVGPSDGFFSLQMRRRGAEVVAVDYRPKEQHGFAAMEQITGESFTYLHSNLYDMSEQELGQFDHVLFLGVLYHLPDMMRALAKLRPFCSKFFYLETHYEPDLTPNISAARYYVGSSLGGDFTNFWAPNRSCVHDMLFDVGFDVMDDHASGSRLVVRCRVSNDEARLLKIRTAYGVM